MSLLAVLGGAFVVWGVFIGMKPLGDNSFLTHLATGRLIFGHGIPRSDPYSFTAHGDPWVVQSWLASALYAGAEEVAGLGGLRLLMAATTAVLAALVWRLSRPAGSVLGRVMVTVLVVAVGTDMWVQRPLLFGLVFMAIVLIAAEGHLDPRWLVPVMWAWANMHGSFPLGIVALVVLAAGRRLDGERPAAELAALRWALVGVAAAVVNPLGPRLLAFPLELLHKSSSFTGIIEWQAPTWGPRYEKVFAVQVAVALLLLVRRRRFRTLLPLVVFTAAALTSLRNVPVASLVLLPGMASGAHGLGTVRGDTRNRAAKFALAGVVLLGAVITLSSLSGPAVALSDYPVASAVWMRQHDMLGLRSRVVSRDYVGNFLEARYGPDEVRVFFDDRVDMYPSHVTSDYLTLLHARPGWEAVLDRYHASAVLWDKDSALTPKLRRSSRWRRVHEDRTWIVWMPR